MDLGILISVCCNYRNRSNKTYVYSWGKRLYSCDCGMGSLYIHRVRVGDQIKPIYYDILWLKSPSVEEHDRLRSSFTELSIHAVVFFKLTLQIISFLTKIYSVNYFSSFCDQLAKLLVWMIFLALKICTFLFLEKWGWFSQTYRPIYSGIDWVLKDYFILLHWCYYYKLF